MPKKSISFLENLIDSSPNAVITTDNDGIIQTVNRAAERIFGIENKEFILKPIDAIFGEPFDIAFFENKLNSEEAIEVNCIRKNGEVFPARIQLSSFSSADDNDQLTLFIFSDIDNVKISMKNEIGL